MLIIVVVLSFLRSSCADSAVDFYSEAYDTYAAAGKTKDVTVKTDKLSGALSLFRQYISLYPDGDRNLYAHIMIGIVCAELHRFDESLQAYNQAVGLQPSSPASLAWIPRPLLYPSRCVTPRRMDWSYRAFCTDPKMRPVMCRSSYVFMEARRVSHDPASATRFSIW